MEQTISLRVTAALLAAVAAGTYTAAEFGDDVAVRLAFINGECEAGSCTLKYTFAAEAVDPDLGAATQAGMHSVNVLVSEADLVDAVTAPGPIGFFNVECENSVCRAIITPSNGDRSKAIGLEVAEALLVERIKQAPSVERVDKSEIGAVKVFDEAADTLPSKK